MRKVLLLALQCGLAPACTAWHPTAANSTTASTSTTYGVPTGEVTGVFGLATLTFSPGVGTITAQTMGQQYTASSGSNGRFSLRLPPGTYLLSGRSENGGGYCPAPSPVIVEAGATYEVDITCQGF